MGQRAGVTGCERAAKARICRDFHHETMGQHAGRIQAQREPDAGNSKKEIARTAANPYKINNSRHESRGYGMLVNLFFYLRLKIP